MSPCAVFVITPEVIWTAAGAVVALVFGCLILLAAARRA